MDEIYRIETIEQYNNMYGFKTMHPLVAYVEFDESNSKLIPGRHTNGFYSLFLKETKGCVINYGKTKYDFDGQTIVSIAPDQVVGFESVVGVPKKAKGILFHPDFLHGTSLERKMKDYTFFSYASNEALHLSEDERKIITDCMAIVGKELLNPIDRHTKSLVTTNIELILDYCLRFYERQFVTRQNLNLGVIARFENLVDEYIASGKTETEGLPTVKYFADKVFLSPNYFGDMVKAETGKTAQEYIAVRLFGYAKRQLAS
ncbi:MAG TPA: AraC family transcriptional regulator, partial [Rikenellaceae bacterium]|nr:AraC family transcriptional regulator [Rikenellaceae bacterium]